jgi:hypothetical protein
MKLNAFTHLAYLINRILRFGPDPDLSYREIFVAARDGELISLLARRYRHCADFCFLLARPGRLEQMEAALCDAASGFDGRMGRATGQCSSLCLVLDIVIEAMQQQFGHLPFSSPALSAGCDPQQ